MMTTDLTKYQLIKSASQLKHVKVNSQHILYNTTRKIQVQTISDSRS